MATDLSTAMNKFSLEFSDREREQRFRLNFRRLEQSFLLYFIIVLFVANLIFALKDTYFTSSRAEISILFQLYAVLPTYVVIWCVIRFLNMSYGQYYAMACFIYLFTFLSQLGMLYLNGYGYEKVVGILPAILFGMYGFSGVLYKDSLKFTPILIIFIILFYLEDHNFSRGFLIFSLLMLAVSLFSAASIKHRTEYLQRFSFLQTEKLSESKKELEIKNDQIQDMSDLRKRFITLLAHDIRSPLNNISAIIKMASNAQLNIEDTKGLLVKLDSQVQSVNTLVYDILIWMKNQSKEVNSNLSTLDIRSTVEELKTLFDEKLNEKQIALKSELEIENIRCHPELVKAVLRNLVSNALKFTEEGAISIITKRDTDMVQLAVKDDGIGMSKKQIHSIGQLMESKAGTRKESGTGLGLKICQELLSMHDSKLTVDSKIDVGTTFSFNLKNQT